MSMTSDGATANGSGEAGTDELVSRLLLIEDQPLDERAVAFAHVHDELQSALERGDAHSRNA